MRLATVAWAVAILDLQQLAAAAKDLVASVGVQQRTEATAQDRTMLGQVHGWLVQAHLLDGQGLAELLTQEQLQ